MKPYSIVFVLLLMFTMVSCFESRRDCQSFRNGTFQFEAIIGTTVESTTFIRNDSLEIDLFRGKTDTSTIRWINDCEYILEKLRPKNQAEKRAVHVKILSATGNEYTFEYKLVGSEKKQKGKAIKI